MWSM
jgi:hypothetical protein